MKTTKALFGILTITMVLAVQVQAQNWLTNGLVAYYPFSGNANDATGSGNNGYAFNTVGTTNRFGSPNAALYFNGTNASVAISNQFLDIGHDYTLSMWFCTFDAAWQYQDLVNSRPNPAIDVMYNAPVHGGDLYLDFSIGTGTDWLQPTQQHGPKRNYVAHQWYHIVAIKSGFSYSTFVDAVLDASFARSPGSRLVGLQIGSGQYNYGDPTPSTCVYGIMDDVRIYNRALTAVEVQQLYVFESGPRVQFVKAFTVDYASLTVGSNYQLQASADMTTWTNWGSQFTAISVNYTNTDYYRIDNWNSLYFRLKMVP